MGCGAWRQRTEDNVHVKLCQAPLDLTRVILHHQTIPPWVVGFPSHAPIKLAFRKQQWRNGPNVAQWSDKVHDPQLRSHSLKLIISSASKTSPVVGIEHSGASELNRISLRYYSSAA
jgi:hypothetical protein